MISVIMPVYNREKFLSDAIKSILNQTYKNFELIIVNDGSTDNSEDIILSFTDPRIKYIKQENGGVAAARNKGLDNAQGDFILFHDSDDISLPMRFELMRHKFASPNVSFVHCDMLEIDELHRPTRYWQYRNIEKARLLRFFLKMGNAYSVASIMLRRSAIEGLHYDTSLRVGSDADFVLRIPGNWTSIHISEPLLLYRWHSSNITKEAVRREHELHVQKFLSRHTLEELIPEIEWSQGNAGDNKAKACAIVALLLYRRHMLSSVETWLNRAINLAQELNAELFVKAIGSLIFDKPDVALQILDSFTAKDHIIENYLGEAYALLGDTANAYRKFMRALELKPHYEEPLDNLKALAGPNGLYTLDICTRKFACA
ncbi:MAG: glycosyltransferase [Firmicutes bacterium]|nr:glycosyltransferase [Bacillota bacterium]